jgi:hypothetical protein
MRHEYCLAALGLRKQNKEWREAKWINTLIVRGLASSTGRWVLDLDRRAGKTWGEKKIYNGVGGFAGW